MHHCNIIQPASNRVLVTSHLKNPSHWRQRDFLVALGFPWDPRVSAGLPFDGSVGAVGPAEEGSQIFGTHLYVLHRPPLPWVHFQCY